MAEQNNNAAEVISVGKVIISIIKKHIAGTDYEVPADVDFKKLFSLAERHKVTALIAAEVIKCPTASVEVKKAFQKELFKSSVRYETQLKEKNELTQLFCQKKIAHCFLKGQKIARYYENPEERYMLDMDIYIPEEKLCEAEEILLSRGYVLNTFGDDKDVGYIKKPFLNIELHRELKYDYDKGYEYYKGAFSRMLSEENGYTLNMTYEDFYVYILSHCAHHFESGGTGIRNILDHYYLNKFLRPQCRSEKLCDSLENIGLTEFSRSLDSLSEMWFGDAQENENSREVGDYVLLSGVFGNSTNAYLSGILRGSYSEKKSSYVLSRLFPSAKAMAPRYPVLNKLPWLAPLFWIVRFFSAVFSEKDYKKEINNVGSASDEDKTNFAEFMKKNGL